MNPEEIVKNSFSYSEIDIVNEKDESNKYLYRKPDYIMVHDSINEDSLKAARKLNIPIVIIRERRLTIDEQFTIPFDDVRDKYVNSDYDERKMRSTR